MPPAFTLRLPTDSSSIVLKVLFNRILHVLPIQRRIRKMIRYSIPPAPDMPELHFYTQILQLVYHPLETLEEVAVHDGVAFGVDVAVDKESQPSLIE